MAWEPVKLRYSHEALAEQILANPAATNIELGKVFGRTPTWVGLLRASGMFREFLIARHGEIVDPVLTASVEERLRMLTNRSLEVLNEKLQRPAQDIPDNLALAAAALGAKGLSVGGFSSKPAPPPEPPATNRIELLAERLVRLSNPQGVTDVFIPDPVPQRATSVPPNPGHAHEAALQHG
jgi:hypothetical protein